MVLLHTLAAGWTKQQEFWEISMKIEVGKTYQFKVAGHLHTVVGVTGNHVSYRDQYGLHYFTTLERFIKFNTKLA